MRSMLTGAVLVAALSLSACAPMLAAVPVAVGVYCAGVSEAGKDALRDLATGGVQLIHCEPHR